VRDDLPAYVRTHLGHPSGVLVIDETSVLKKGTHAVGVGCQ
jgi:SRSO17 transposase